MTTLRRQSGYAARITATSTLFLLFLLSLFYSPIIMAETTCTNSIIEVYPDGSVLINETLSVQEAPSNITVRLLAPPIYVFAIDSDGIPLPLNYNNTHAVISVYSSGQVTLSYYTLNLTTKAGDIWTLTLEAKCPTTIILPDNSVPVSMNPTPNPVIIGNRTGFEFPPDTTITMNYYVLPSQFIPTHTNTPGTTQTTTTTETTTAGQNNYIYLISIILLLIILLYLFQRHRGKKSSSEIITTPPKSGSLDDRDQKILEALKRKPMSAPELMHETRIPKTPLYRRLKRLVDEGFIEYYEENGVRIYRLRSEDASQ